MILDGYVQEIGNNIPQQSEYVYIFRITHSRVRLGPRSNEHNLVSRK